MLPFSIFNIDVLIFASIFMYVCMYVVLLYV